MRRSLLLAILIASMPLAAAAQFPFGADAWCMIDDQGSAWTLTAEGAETGFATMAGTAEVGWPAPGVVTGYVQKTPRELEFRLDNPAADGCRYHTSYVVFTGTRTARLVWGGTWTSYCPGDVPIGSGVWNGTFSRGECDEAAPRPATYARGRSALVRTRAPQLRAAYPNPFNPATRIAIDLPTEATVRLIIVNTLGQEVARLLDGRLPAGSHERTFDATGLPTGVYFSVLHADGVSETRPLLLLR